MRWNIFVNSLNFDNFDDTHKPYVNAKAIWCNFPLNSKRVFYKYHQRKVSELLNRFSCYYSHNHFTFCKICWGKTSVSFLNLETPSEITSTKYFSKLTRSTHAKNWRTLQVLRVGRKTDKDWKSPESSRDWTKRAEIRFYTFVSAKNFLSTCVTLDKLKSTHIQ